MITTVFFSEDVYEEQKTICVTLRAQRFIHRPKSRWPSFLGRDSLDDTDVVVRHDDVATLEASESKARRYPGRQRAAERVGGPGFDDHLELVVDLRVQLLQVQDAVL